MKTELDQSEIESRRGPNGGYLATDEGSGEMYRTPYTYPFIVRGQGRPLGVYDNPEWHSVASFRTMEEAQAWLARWEAEYKKGRNGFARMRIENWNA